MHPRAAGRGAASRREELVEIRVGNSAPPPRFRASIKVGKEEIMGMLAAVERG